MSKSVDFEQIKQKLLIFWDETRRKLSYLLVCINRFGVSGVVWWVKTHAQNDNFKLALADLQRELKEEEVNLSRVEETFLEFIVPEEDLGHVYWYSDAQKKLAAFEANLDKNHTIDVKLLQQAMNELKFISQSNDFHQTYQLEGIQNRISAMYQELQNKIVAQQSIEREKIELDKQKQVVALAEAEAEKTASIAKAKMMESMKVKEKRLAIIEEKKRQVAERETAEIKRKEQSELAEIKAKQAELERQAELQRSYGDLEVKEKVKDLPLEELVEIVNQKIEQKKILTFIQIDQLSKLRHTIEEKKAM